LADFITIAVGFKFSVHTGVVLQRWAPQAGHYPEIAYQTAFALNLALQVAVGAVPARRYRQGVIATADRLSGATRPSRPKLQPNFRELEDSGTVRGAAIRMGSRVNQNECWRI
jgi:hypothetical protein